MRETGLVESKRVAYFEYDYTRHGGAVGDITVGGDVIPKGAIITSGVNHVKSACTSGGAATVAAKAVSAGDIMASTAVGSLTANALIDCTADGTAANMVRCASNVTGITVTIGTAALTGGKIVFAIEYVVTD